MEICSVRNKRNTSTVDSERRNSLADRKIARTGMEPTVHLLNYELHVVSIHKDALSGATHPLLQILLKLFQNSECRRNHFFSFTETAAEYSVILDNDLLEILRPATSSLKIEVAESKWRALVVEVGAMGSLAGVSSIAASVIAPLANCGVSVFCVSTNMDDFVLVKESSLSKALGCLARSFSITSESKHDSALINSVIQNSTRTDSPQGKKSITPCYNKMNSRPITHPYFCSSSQYSVCGIIPKALPTIGTSLLQLMLFNQRISSGEETFFSFSIVEDDISIVLDCKDLVRFPEDSLYLNEETWRMIRIGEGPLGFDECGIVAQVSAPLAQASISTYYICTFHTDHTLVREENVEKALKLLNDRYVSKLMSCTGTLSVPPLPLKESSLCTSSYTALSDSTICSSGSICTGSYVDSVTYSPLTTN